jgi:hypothetical protein
MGNEMTDANKAGANDCAAQRSTAAHGDSERHLGEKQFRLRD